ncbi:hypothetical protein HPULCUR_006556 [Helicostylum pulchrum]|uniref:Uncharacterized protein n=1 Tax=Helicostylum pulchrum TaxID=562976 RepID=A0ABP9Y2B3_9FUNG
MHIYTLFSVIIASILVTLTSAKSFGKENSMAGVRQDIDNRRAHRNVYKKREIRNGLLVVRPDPDTNEQPPKLNPNSDPNYIPNYIPTEFY